MTNSNRRPRIFSTGIVFFLFAGSVFSADTLFAPAGLLSQDLGPSTSISDCMGSSKAGGISSDLRGSKANRKETGVTYTLENAITKSDSTILQTGADSLFNLLNNDTGTITSKLTVTFTLSNKFKTGNPKRVLITGSKDADSTLLKQIRDIFKSLHFKGNAVYGQKIKMCLQDAHTRDKTIMKK